MSIDLVDIADWLETVTPFQQGTTLQVNHFSTKAPDRCIMITNNTGGGHDIDNSTRIDYMLSVYSRSFDWHEAQEDQAVIFDIFKELSHIQLSTFHIETIENITYPQQYGRDTKDRFLFYAVYKLNIFMNL